MLIAKSVHHGLQLHQLDVVTAFLNGTLDEDVFLKQRKGFLCVGKEFVCKLKKSIYGLKQSPHCWNTTLDSSLKQMGFQQSVSDPYMTFYLGIYVDGIILVGKTESNIQQVKDQLSSQFKILSWNQCDTR